MELHHSKHHNTYVTNLNNALKDHPDLAAKSIEDLIGDLNAVPEAVRTAVRNNGGGHANHTLFWEIMGPNGGGAPSLAAMPEPGRDRRRPVPVHMSVPCPCPRPCARNLCPRPRVQG